MAAEEDEEPEEEPRHIGRKSKRTEDDDVPPPPSPPDPPASKKKPSPKPSPKRKPTYGKPQIFKTVTIGTNEDGDPIYGIVSDTKPDKPHSWPSPGRGTKTAGAITISPARKTDDKEKLKTKAAARAAAIEAYLARQKKD